MRSVRLPMDLILQETLFQLGLPECYFQVDNAEGGLYYAKVSFPRRDLNGNSPYTEKLGASVVSMQDANNQASILALDSLRLFNDLEICDYTHSLLARSLYQAYVPLPVEQEAAPAPNIASAENPRALSTALADLRGKHRLLRKKYGRARKIVKRIKTIVNKKVPWAVMYTTVTKRRKVAFWYKFTLLRILLRL